jgi:phage baseplate assembly protein W
MLGMNGSARGLRFPFGVEGGAITAGDGLDEEIRGKIIQVLFTARGERVNRPEFGCGLLNLVFDPNNEILAAATQFTIGQALTRWLRDEIVVDGVELKADGETLVVEVAYTRRADLARAAVRIQFR